MKNTLVNYESLNSYLQKQLQNGYLFLLLD